MARDRLYGIALFHLLGAAPLFSSPCSAVRLNVQTGCAVSGHRSQKAKAYRERAHRSREVAHGMTVRVTKQHSLETAQHFETLAVSEEAEARKTIPVQTSKREA